MNFRQSYKIKNAVKILKYVQQAVLRFFTLALITHTSSNSGVTSEKAFIFVSHIQNKLVKDVGKVQIAIHVIIKKHPNF